MCLLQVEQQRQARQLAKAGSVSPSPKASRQSLAEGQPGSAAGQASEQQRKQSNDRGKEAPCIPVHADASVGPESARQQQQSKTRSGPGPEGAEGKQIGNELIPAVPEVPNRRASIGLPEAKRGLSSAVPSEGSPLPKQQEAWGTEAEGDMVDGANEADLEALLGHLVSRAEHI